VPFSFVAMYPLPVLLRARRRIRISSASRWNLVRKPTTKRRTKKYPCSWSARRKMSRPAFSTIDSLGILLCALLMRSRSSRLVDAAPWFKWVLRVYRAPQLRVVPDQDRTKVILVNPLQTRVSIDFRPVVLCEESVAFESSRGH
jgi:hypothetical protein